MAQAEAKKLVVTLPSEREIRMTRTFDAPRHLVFEAFTKAEHIARWWGRHGDELVIDAFEPRPGGRWRIVSRGADGSEHGFRGEIREVVPNERIVQTFEWEGLPGHVSVETMTFEERDGKTTIVATSRFDSVEDRDGMLQSGMEVGAAESYDRLEGLLKTLA
jgi:uncharacterized protein YndB with AHSA1/START domain